MSFCDIRLSRSKNTSESCVAAVSTLGMMNINVVECIVTMTTDQYEEPRSPVVSYTYNYDSIICVGEMIRNVCVNLGVDPDTHDGYTRNVMVYKRSTTQAEWVVWEYCPKDSIIKHAVNNVLCLKLQVLYS